MSIPYGVVLRSMWLSLALIADRMIADGVFVCFFLDAMRCDKQASPSLLLAIFFAISLCRRWERERERLCYLKSNDPRMPILGKSSNFDRTCKIRCINKLHNFYLWRSRSGSSHCKTVKSVPIHKRTFSCRPKQQRTRKKTKTNEIINAINRIDAIWINIDFENLNPCTPSIIITRHNGTKKKKNKRENNSNY